MTLAIYPGSFDPLTLGHLNLLQRGTRLFDRIVVAVARNARKQALFSIPEREALIQQAIGDMPNVEVTSFEGLLVDFAKAQGAHVVLRGLRAISDFEFEFQMAHINHQLSAGLETVFMMTGAEHFYVSSQVVREIAYYKGSVTGLVPAHVETALKEKFAT